MPLKSLVFMLFVFTCCAASGVSVNASVPSYTGKTDSVSNEVLIESRTDATGGKNFISRLKHKVSSLMFKKQYQSEEKGSTKVTLGWVSLGLILVSFLNAGSPLTVVTLLAGIATGIVSLAIRKNETEIKKKRKSNLPAIIALSLVLGAAIFLVIALAVYWK